MICERIIFIIGAAAAGKTTYAQRLSQGNDYFWISDLLALQELFALNTPSKIEGFKPHFWPEFEGDTNAAMSLRAATTPLPGGGHEIHNSTIWHEALHRVVLMHQNKRSLIVEFARGADLSQNNPYQAAFDQLFTSQPNLLNCRTAILHLTASFGERQQRNIQRQLAGMHFVDTTVMSRLYQNDPFNFSRNAGASEGSFYSYRSIPVLSLQSGNQTNIDQNTQYLRSWLQEQKLL